MHTEKLIINGYGSSNGGEFHKVQLNGKGTVNGNIDCDEFECNGSGSVNGDLKSENTKISGSGKVDGTVSTENMRIDGKATITKDVKANNLKIAGKGTIGGTLTGEELKIRGQATIDGNCEVDIFSSEGQFTIGGLLSADEIDIDIHGTCRVKEIGGQTIKVRHRPTAFSGLFKTVFGSHLEAELLEGDNIDIDYVKIKTVRGNNVTVGPNCEIGLIEYKGVLHVDKNAKVKEIQQV
ncbi:cytoplasmic protein [Bacillus pseudomycoides]|uniref:polymer-forming cytoskeletal protein n=1 Tax=Bacillus pseudomycoides TaxID=64104 RepID=UPI000BF8680A|nr:polymer-forming cytoskeletal protein [Bacillus pseudomycoides]PGE94379.1 cytoplasmic protein [Bacillus pseudomycoides]PHE37929.1 cytoplasmic protein [Bacillus pseudomycoides]